MKQLERKKTITFRWWRQGKEEIVPAHMDALEETAMERIGEMITAGYSSGDLQDNIHMTDTDPEDGVDYKGWWEYKDTTD